MNGSIMKERNEQNNMDNSQHHHTPPSDSIDPWSAIASLQLAIGSLNERVLELERKVSKIKEPCDHVWTAREKLGSPDQYEAVCKKCGQN